MTSKRCMNLCGIYSNDKLHGEAKGAAQILDENQLHKIVNSTVDPTTTLTEQYTKSSRHGSMTYLRCLDCPALQTTACHVMSSSEAKSHAPLVGETPSSASESSLGSK